MTSRDVRCFPSLLWRTEGRDFSTFPLLCSGVVLLFRKLVSFHVRDFRWVLVCLTSKLYTFFRVVYVFSFHFSVYLFCKKREKEEQKVSKGIQFDLFSPIFFWFMFVEIENLIPLKSNRTHQHNKRLERKAGKKGTTVAHSCTHVRPHSEGRGKSGFVPTYQDGYPPI